MPIRVLHITSTPPAATFGGAMTFFRHFCRRDDFEIAVVGTDSAIAEQEYPSLQLSPSALFSRLSRTRLSPWVHGLEHRLGRYVIPAAVNAFVRKFQPDAIFTVAGAWSSLARLAERVATKNGIPLIGSFNDWWNYNQIYHPFLERSLAQQFLNFYRRCDLAICTSEGMQDALGSHRNSVVIYPTGAEFVPTNSFSPPGNRPLTIGFGGNLGDWYGPMIEGLVVETERRVPGQFQFQLFGSRPSWSASFDERVKREGIFHGQVDFETLTSAMRQCDILLLPMGFDSAIRQIESTSFKTKFLDYLAFEKPIVVWGPEYCSAVRTAGEFDSAEVCDDVNPDVALKVLQRLKEEPVRQATLVANARVMYLDRFHPDRLHQELVSRIKALL
jgi:glycosyltransferase involved in cell wall biosynthesis